MTLLQAIRVVVIPTAIAFSGQALGATIIDGQVVGKDKLPHIVEIETTWGETQCSATLVGPSVILTAGHCLPSEKSAYRVRSRSRDATLSIQTIAFPPGFIDEEYALEHDFALAILSGSFEGVLPATISLAPVPIGRRLVLAGYGCSKFGRKDWGVLRAGSAVTQALEPDYVRSGGEGAGISCKGDSGGPTLLAGGHLRTVVGVNSQAIPDKLINLSSRLDQPFARKFFSDFATRHRVKICGINAKCK